VTVTIHASLRSACDVVRVHTVKDSSSPLNLALTKDNIIIHCMLFSYPLFIVNSSYVGKSSFDLCSQYFPAGYCDASCMRRNCVFMVGIPESSQVSIYTFHR